MQDHNAFIGDICGPKGVGFIEGQLGEGRGTWPAWQDTKKIIKTSNRAMVNEADIPQPPPDGWRTHAVARCIQTQLNNDDILYPYTSCLLLAYMVFFRFA